MHAACAASAACVAAVLWSLCSTSLKRQTSSAKGTMQLHHIHAWSVVVEFEALQSSTQQDR